MHLNVSNEENNPGIYYSYKYNQQHVSNQYKNLVLISYLNDATV